MFFFQAKTTRGFVHLFFWLVFDLGMGLRASAHRHSHIHAHMKRASARVLPVPVSIELTSDLGSCLGLVFCIARALRRFSVSEELPRFRGGARAGHAPARVLGAAVSCGEPRFGPHPRPAVLSNRRPGCMLVPTGGTPDMPNSLRQALACVRKYSVRLAQQHPSGSGSLFKHPHMIQADMRIQCLRL